MLFGPCNPQRRRIINIRIIVVLLLVITIPLSVSACTSGKGSIVILENPNGTGFSMDFKKWSGKNKCQLSLDGGDVLQFEVDRQEGEIALALSGKKGSEPYTGNHLQSGVFTVTVAETDEYVIGITGKDATGKISVKNLGRETQ